MKELVYVTYTCKKCGSAFLDVDLNDNINDLPLKTKYCPDCVLKGFKNDKVKAKETKEQLQKKFFKEQIKENGIVDNRDISFLKKKFFKDIKHKENTNQRVYLNNIFKDALEVLGYQDWKM